MSLEDLERLSESVLGEVAGELKAPEKKAAIKALKTISLPGWKYDSADTSIVAQWSNTIKGVRFLLQVNPFPMRGNTSGTGSLSAAFWVDRGSTVVGIDGPAVNFDLKNAQQALLALTKTPEDELMKAAREWVR